MGILNRNNLTTIAIHQPNYFPWMGYFLKMASADTFVYHDAVTLNTRSYTRRCYIKPQNTTENQRLSIGLKSISQNQLISDVLLSIDRKWQTEHWKTIEQTYQKSPYFSETSAWVYDLIVDDKHTHLADYNIAILKKIANYIDVQTTWVKSSTLSITGETTDAKHLSIITQLGGDHYLSGIGSRAYQDDETYRQQGIMVSYLESLSLLESVVGSNTAQLSILDYLFDSSQTELISLIKRLTT